MNTNGVQIVDRGRGPQLSTCRITVQDLIPYILQNYTDDQIIQIMPILSAQEIQAVRQYIQDNGAEVMAQDQRIRARNQARQRPPEVEEAERQERQRRLDAARRAIRQQKPESSGDPATR
jgi:uncharacterized protein (DUF433 family)